METVMPSRLSTSVSSNRAAVQEWNVADDCPQPLGQVSGIGVVQAGEEQGAESVAVEITVAQSFAVVLPQGVQVVGVVAEPEPRFAGQEVDEHQPVEQRLHEDPLVLVIPVAKPGDGSHCVIENALVLGEEVLGDRFDVEGLVQRSADDSYIAVFPENGSHPFHRGSLRKVTLHHHTAQRRAGALELGQNEVQLADRGVGEHQQELVAKLFCDQPGRGINLGLPHAVGGCGVEADVQYVDAVQHCDALGGIGQQRIGGPADQADLAGIRMEVQSLDEQAPDCVCPAIRGARQR